MKIIDIIFALICGKVVGLLVTDFLKGLEIRVGLYGNLVIWLVFALSGLFFLWISYIIGKKLLFVFQAGKHLLVGAFATVVDLKLFELLLWCFGFFMVPYPLIIKGISFIFSTLLKYWGNKHWAFGKSRLLGPDKVVDSRYNQNNRGSSMESGHRKENLRKEIAQFFTITLVGLIIDVAIFYYATKIVGTVGTIPRPVWIKLSVIFATLAAALWNFLGYKFFVFKK